MIRSLLTVRVVIERLAFLYVPNNPSRRIKRLLPNHCIQCGHCRVLPSCFRIVLVAFRRVKLKLRLFFAITALLALSLSVLLTSTCVVYFFVSAVVFCVVFERLSLIPLLSFSCMSHRDAR